ncbi:hypothetical protein JCM10295v2_005652 [Rhodotorula toruloides]
MQHQFAAAFSIVAISSYATDVFGLGYFLNSLFQRVGPLKMIVLISIPLYAAIIITVVLIWVSKSTRRASTKFSIMQRE